MASNAPVCEGNAQLWRRRRTHSVSHLTRFYTSWSLKKKERAALDICLGGVNRVIFIHSYIHTFIHSYIHTFIHSYIHTFIHSYIHTFIHSYIHTFIHSYIHHRKLTWIPKMMVWKPFKSVPFLVFMFNFWGVHILYPYTHYLFI